MTTREIPLTFPHANIMPEPSRDPDFTTFIREGCPKAFERIIKRRAGAVHSAARRTLGQRAHLAEDVAQMVFLTLAKKGRTLPETLILGAWLHRQTVRLSLNALRGEIRRTKREESAIDLYDHDPMNDAFKNEPEWADVMPHIDRAIDDLPKPDQEALTLRFTNGLKMAQIASHFGVETNAMEKRIGRALAKLRKRLAHRGVTPSIAILSLWLTDHSAGAAPPLLIASITKQTTTFIEPGTSALISTATTMTIAKSTAIGATFGILLGGLATWGKSESQATTDSPSKHPSQTRTRTSKDNHSSEKNRTKWAVIQPQTTAESMLEQIQLLLDEPDHNINRQRMRALLLALPADQFAPMLTLASENISKSWELKRFLVEFVPAWVGVDPANAVAGLLESEKIRGMKSPRVLAISAFDLWNDSSQYDSQEWLITNQADETIQEILPHLVKTIAKGMATESHESVFLWASQIGGSDLKVAAISALWSSLSDTYSEEPHGAAMPDLLDRLQKIEDQEVANLATQSFLNDWATYRTSDLQLWLAEQAPSELAYQAALASANTSIQVTINEDQTRSYRTFSRDHSLTSAQLALSLAPDRNQSAVVADVLRGASTIPPEMIDWAIPKLDGPERNTTILETAQTILTASSTHFTDGRTPLVEVALTWARHIDDPAIRDPFISQHIQQYLKDNPSQAQAFINQNNWPEELQSVLRGEEATNE